MTAQPTSDLNAETLQAALPDRPLRFYPSVQSTNDLARNWQIDDPVVPDGALVVADEQTGGRGRAGRRWYTPPGQAIALSVILRPDIDPDALHQITMLGGLAVVETVSAYVPGDLQADLSLKWPNDVLLAERKLCGILTEAVWLGNMLQAVILGIGLNVHINFESTPLATIATSLHAHTSQPLDRVTLVRQLVQRIEAWQPQLGTEQLVNAWRAWLGTLGQTVDFQTVQHGLISGQAVDVDASGALLIEDESGQRHRVRVGDVQTGQV